MTRLFVIGDALLDRDLRGRAERLAPDAPVPVVDAIEPTARPGGAAWPRRSPLARAWRSRSSPRSAVTPPGEELPRCSLRRRRRDRPRPARCHPEKIRVLARRPARSSAWTAAATAHGCGPLPPGALDGADAMLVSDYGRGVGRGTDGPRRIDRRRAGRLGPAPARP